VGAADQLREHRGRAIGQVLGQNDVFEGNQPVDLDAIQGDDQFFGFAESDLVGRGSGLAALADAFADVERYAARGPALRVPCSVSVPP